MLYFTAHDKDRYSMLNTEEQVIYTELSAEIGELEEDVLLQCNEVDSRDSEIGDLKKIVEDLVGEVGKLEDKIEELEELTDGMEVL